MLLPELHVSSAIRASSPGHSRVLSISSCATSDSTCSSSSAESKTRTLRSCSCRSARCERAARNELAWLVRVVYRSVRRKVEDSSREWLKRPMLLACMASRCVLLTRVYPKNCRVLPKKLAPLIKY